MIPHNSQRLRKAADRLRRSATIRRIGWLVTGTLLSNALVLVTLPLLTRWYSPSAFGSLAVFIAAAAVISPLFSFRLEIALFQPRSDRMAIRLGAVAGVVCAVVTAITLPFAWRFADEIAGLFNAPDLAPVVLLLPVAAAAYIMFMVLTNLGVRLRRERLAGMSKIHRAGVQVSIQLGLGLVSFGPGLIIGELLGRLYGACVLAFGLISRIRGKARLNVRKIRALLRRYSGYLTTVTPAALINTAVMQLPPILLGATYGASVAGLYFLAQRILGTPMALLGQSIGQVFASRIGETLQSDPQKAKALYCDAARHLVLYGAFPLAGIAAVAPWGLPFLLGEGWEQSGWYVLLLAPMLLGQFVMSPLVNTLHLAGFSARVLAWDSVRLLLAVVVITAPSLFGGAAWMAVLGYSVVMAAGYLVIHWIVLSSLGKLKDKSKR